MSTFPPAPATFTDPNLSASRFLANPAFVAHRIQTLGDLRYVGNLLLTGRQSTNGGAVGYETVEGIFADAPPETVAPGAEYTMTTIVNGPAGLARVVKSGKDTLITDESIARASNRVAEGPVEKGLRKLVNSQGKAIDGSIVSLIASAVTGSAAAASAWASSTAILRDILKAKAVITGQNLGYEPNVLLVDDLTGALLGSDPTIASAMAREDRMNPIYTGRFPVIAGLEVVTTPTVNLPGGTAKAWVLDTRQLGFIATEDLGGGYQQAGDLVQSKVMRIDENDAWRIRARANFAPVVTDPLAGYAITGI